MDDLQEILKQYKISKTGDMNAIRCILSNMGDGKLLKSDLPFELKCFLELAEQSDESAYKTLYALKEVDFENKPLYFEPDYIKYIRKEKKLAEGIQIGIQILSEMKAWKAAEEKAAEEKAQKDAERERKRLEREQKRLEEEARKRAEEEERELAIVSALRDKAFDTLKSIVENMIHISGGTFLMGSPGDKLNLPHKETVPDFWLSKRAIEYDDMENLLFEEDSCTSIDVAKKFIKRLSLILECPFDLPPASSLEYAFRGGENYTIDNVINTELLDVDRNGVEWTSTIIGKNDIRISISCSSLSFKTFGSAYFRLYCTNSKIEEIQRRYKELAEEKKRQAEEERRLAAEEKRRAEKERKKAQEKRLLQLKQQQLTIQQEKEAKLKEEWNAVVESFLNDVDTFEYESGFFFNRKRVQIRYVKQPLCERIYTAIKYRESLVEWEKQNEKFKDPKHNWIITSDWKLNEFIKKFNEYKGSECAFDFLHNYKDVEERLRKNGKIGSKGAYLIIK